MLVYYWLLGYIAALSLIATLLSVAPFVSRCLQGDQRTCLANVPVALCTYGVLAFCSGIAAIILGACARGVPAAIADLRVGLLTIGWMAGGILALICWNDWITRRAPGTPRTCSSLQAKAPPSIDPHIEIKHKNRGKVLWRMAAATLEGADLYHATLQGADLRGADLCGADLRGADLSRADLRSLSHACSAETVHFILFHATLCLLVQWACRHHVLPFPEYPGITGLCVVFCFRSIHDLSARWRQTLRSRPNLRNVILQEANLAGALLVAARLEGAIYDARTRWPRGFDPEQHGAVRVVGD